MYLEKKIIGKFLYWRHDPKHEFTLATGPVADMVNALLAMDDYDRGEVLRLITNNR